MHSRALSLTLAALTLTAAGVATPGPLEAERADAAPIALGSATMPKPGPRTPSTVGARGATPAPSKAAAKAQGRQTTKAKVKAKTKTKAKVATKAKATSKTKVAKKTKVATKRIATTPTRPAQTTAVARVSSTSTAASVAKAFVARTTAGTRPVRDRAGNVWSARSVGWGSWKSDSIPAATDIAGTLDDALYRTNAWDMRWYWVDVPARGTYQVRLKMAESYFGAAGQRVFDVSAEGRTVATNVDIVKSVGRAAAHDITFAVPVTDGRLDLDFVYRADKPAIAAIEVTGPGAARASAPTPAVKLSPKAFYTQSIRKAPLASNSAAMAALLAKDVADNWGGVAAVNAYQYNTSFYTVPAKQPTVDVAFHDCQRKGYVPTGLFDGPKYFKNVPVPASVVPAVGTDGEVTIYDPAADKIWEFWQMSKTVNGGWRACWGGRLDNVSTSTQVAFPSPYGASASGLVMAPGMITMEEFRAGRIEHAMYLAILRPRAWPHFSWPANRTDGGNPDPNALMEGQRLRLDPTLDVSTLGLTPVGEMVARAAQEYGFVVSDGAGAVAVVTESGDAQKALTGKNPWDRLLGGPSYQALAKFPWDRMQVLPKDYGRP